MANWNNPTITSQYDVFVAEAKDRDVDSGTMFKTDPTNPVAGLVRYNRATKIFEEWSGSAWTPIVMGITGGGTGASSAGGAVAALGLGTMAFQNSNNINVTGGQINNVLWLTCTVGVRALTDLGADSGTLAFRWRNCYVGTGMVIPVGVDKFVVG